MRKKILFIIILLFWGITQQGIVTSLANGRRINFIMNDEEEIKDLIRSVLKWQDENNITFLGFEPTSNNSDSIYTGMNLKELEKGIKTLSETGFFGNEFLENYKEIILMLDKKLRRNEIKWYIDEMAPFGGLNPWCKCQDVPYDNPWDKIKFKFIDLSKDSAKLTWTWGDLDWSKSFSYLVKVRKVNGKWKITYLEGFDLSEFFDNVK